MQITIFGASGRVGRLVVELALDRGYTVIAFVHTRNPFTASEQLVIKRGDMYNPADVADALLGSEAVISTLGSWGTPSKEVLTTAMRSIIPVMAEHKIRRIVTLTGSGAATPDEPASAGHKLLLRLLAPFPAGKVFRDGEAHLRLLAASKLDWTTIRSPVMNNRGSKDYYLRLRPGLPLATINRAAVARALLDQLDATDCLRQAPIISRK